jgi:hypothetical protein
MKTYKVKTVFIFSGDILIKAENKDEAKRIAKEDFGMSFGSITSNGDDSVDWDFDMTPEKKIKSVTLKRKR